MGGLRGEVLFIFVSLLELELAGELLDFGKIIFLFNCTTVLETYDFLRLLSFND